MSIKKQENNWLGRSLVNYKSMHVKAADARGNRERFLASKTLTEARRLAFGTKKGNKV